MKVLFVDDSVDNLNLYKLYFKKMTEIEIDYFADPREGLSHALNDTYDLIFLDIQMPDLDGFEFKVKLDKSKIVATVCALTGFSDESTLEKIESHNFAEIIKKPILKKDLVELVDKYKNRIYDER